MKENDMSVGLNDIDQVYRAVGEGLHNWSLLEMSLADLHFRLLAINMTGALLPVDERFAKGMNSANNSFYAIGNIRAKCGVIKKSISNYGDEIAKTEWREKSKEIQKLQSIRNVFAHGVIYGATGDHARDFKIFMNDIFTTDFHQKVATRSVKGFKIIEAPSKFKQMRENIEAFTKKFK